MKDSPHVFTDFGRKKMEQETFVASDPSNWRTLSISSSSIPIFSENLQDAHLCARYHGFDDKKGLFLSWEVGSLEGRVLRTIPFCGEGGCWNPLLLPCDDFPFSWEVGGGKMEWCRSEEQLLCRADFLALPIPALWAWANASWLNHLFCETEVMVVSIHRATENEIRYLWGT